MKKAIVSRNSILGVSALLYFGALCTRSHGAAGDLDHSFDAGSGLDGEVNSMVVQADGKVIIAGRFDITKGLMRSNFARLNPDGTGDSSFAQMNINERVSAIAALVLQPDGKVLVGHSTGLTRFDSDGMRESFNATTIFKATAIDGFSSSIPVRLIALQPDGKVLIGGGFNYVDGTLRNGIARIGANGWLDPNFDPGTGVTRDSGVAGAVFAMAVQADGKIVIGGEFANFDRTRRNNIARLKADGSLDRTFFPGSGADGSVYAVAVQADGKVLIGGSFTSLNGTSRPGVARLHPDGSLDQSFDPGPAMRWASRIVLMPNGQLLVHASYDRGNGLAVGMIRLNADGSLDSSFDPGRAGYGSGDVGSFALQADGKLLINGRSDSRPGGLARLHADGSLDAAFQPYGGVQGPVNSVAAQPDGKVLIGGRFSFVDNTRRNGVARLNADGSLDGSFIPDAGINPYVRQISLQPDGRVLVGGSFACDEFEGTERGGIIRLNSDGSRDSRFDPGCGVPGSVSLISLQADGKILIGGGFGTVNGTERPGIARLNADGSLDTGFNPDINGILLVGAPLCIVPQPDGKVLMGGYGGGLVNGTIRGGLTRFNADGSLDGSFNSGRGGHVRAIALLPDGRMLIGGYFSTAADVTRFSSIARLHPDGSLDSSFHVPEAATSEDYVGILGGASSFALQPDGKILCSGNYYLGVDEEGHYMFGSSPFRLHADGRLDLSYHASVAFSAMVLLPDGKLLTGGGYHLGHNIARLLGDAIVPSLNIALDAGSAVLSWPAGSGDFQLQESAYLSLPDAWAPVGQVPMVNGNQLTVTLPVTQPRQFFRLVSLEP